MIETTTQFPIDSGTVVEVKCSQSNAVNKGSSILTCSVRTEFDFSKEPSCSILGTLKSLSDINWR